MPPVVTTTNVFRHFQMSSEWQNNPLTPGCEPLLYTLSLSNPSNTLWFSYDLSVNHAHFITSIQTLFLSSSDNIFSWIFLRECKAQSKKYWSSNHTSPLAVSCLLIRRYHPPVSLIPHFDSTATCCWFCVSALPQIHSLLSILTTPPLQVKPPSSIA